MATINGKKGYWPSRISPTVKETGKPAWDELITCKKCGRGDSITHRNTRSSNAGHTPTIAAFAKKGWIKINMGQGVCPVCSSAPIIEKAKEMASPQPNDKTPIVAMRSPAAQAKIPELYLMLGEAYEPKTKSYKKDWSDARIAADLGMAEDFVRARREMDFGPLAPPKADPLAEIDKAFADVEKYKLTGSTAVDELYGQIGKLNAAIANARRMLDAAKAGL